MRRIELLRAVEREHAVIALATNVLRAQLAVNPSELLQYNLERHDFQQSVDNLSATYLIRLVAEFESGLREVWRGAYRKKSNPRTRELVEALGTRCSVPLDVADGVEAVRIFRNALVHEATGIVETVSLEVAGRFLRRFFSRLPPDW